MILPFAEYRPDLPDYVNPGDIMADNVIADQMSYRPFPDLVDYSNAIDARCQGFYSTLQSDATSWIFAGNASKLYKANGTTFSDVSKVGGYNTDASEGWDFTKYGDRVIGTNFADPMQSFVMGTSTIFADLVASPKARYITTIGNFVMVANVFDSTDGNVPIRVHWCHRGDPTAWTVSATNQGDRRDLESRDGGHNQQIVGGEFVSVFQERSIWRGYYSGPPPVFTFDEVLPGIGTPAPWSVAQLGRVTFFLADQGFARLVDGADITWIGANKIDTTFLNDVDQSAYHRIRSAVDPINKLWLIAYPNGSATAQTPNRLAIYNYQDDKWTTAGLDIECLGNALSTGYTLDELDALGYNLDTLPFSLDSRVWAGGRSNLAAFGSNEKLGFFTGSALEATIDTGEREPNEGGQYFARRSVPLVDGGSPTVALGTRKRLQDSVTFSTAQAVTADGYCPTRVRGKYLRGRMVIPAADVWEHAQGIKLEGRNAGKYA